MIAHILRAAFVLAAIGLAWFSLPVAIIAIVAVALVIIQSKANSLIEFSFGPLKAKLERELSDAEKVVEKLKHLAVLQAKAAMMAAMRTGRWAGGDDVWQFEHAKQLEQALREIGSSEDALREVRADLVWFAVFDAGHSATGGNLVPSHLDEQARKEWSEARDKTQFRNPDVVTEWLSKWGQMTPERQTLIDDMRWMESNQDVKDIEQFRRTKRTIEWSK